MLNQPRTNRAEPLTDYGNSPANTGAASNAPVANDVAVAKILPIWNNEKIKERFDRLVGLEYGWDGHNAVPVDSAIAIIAMQILQKICPRHLDLPNPDIVPGRDGSVQLEWHIGDYDIEIDFLTLHEVEAWRCNIKTGAEDEQTLSPADASVLAQWMIDLSDSLKRKNNKA